MSEQRRCGYILDPSNQHAGDIQVVVLSPELALTNAIRVDLADLPAQHHEAIAKLVAGACHWAFELGAAIQRHRDVELSDLTKYDYFPKRVLELDEQPNLIERYQASAAKGYGKPVVYPEPPR